MAREAEDVRIDNFCARFRDKTRPGDDHTQVILRAMENFDGGFQNTENTVAPPMQRILRGGKITGPQFVSAAANYLGQNLDPPMDQYAQRFKSDAELTFARFDSEAEAPEGSGLVDQGSTFVDYLVERIVSFSQGAKYQPPTEYAQLAMRMSMRRHDRAVLENAFRPFDYGNAYNEQQADSCPFDVDPRRNRKGEIHFMQFYGGLKNYLGNNDYIRALKEKSDVKEYVYDFEAWNFWLLLNAMAGRDFSLLPGNEGELYQQWATARDHLPAMQDRLTLGEVVSGLLWIKENALSIKTQAEVLAKAKEHLKLQKLKVLTALVRRSREHSTNRNALPARSGRRGQSRNPLLDKNADNVAKQGLERMLIPFLVHKGVGGHEVRHWDPVAGLYPYRVIAREGAVDQEQFHRAVNCFFPATREEGAAFQGTQAVAANMAYAIFADLDVDKDGWIPAEDLSAEIVRRVAEAQRHKNAGHPHGDNDDEGRDEERGQAREQRGRRRQQYQQEQAQARDREREREKEAQQQRRGRSEGKERARQAQQEGALADPVTKHIGEVIRQERSVAAARMQRQQTGWVPPEWVQQRDQQAEAVPQQQQQQQQQEYRYWDRPGARARRGNTVFILGSNEAGNEIRTADKRYAPIGTGPYQMGNDDNDPLFERPGGGMGGLTQLRPNNRETEQEEAKSWPRPLVDSEPPAAGGGAAAVRALSAGQKLLQQRYDSSAPPVIPPAADCSSNSSSSSSSSHSSTIVKLLRQMIRKRRPTHTTREFVFNAFSNYCVTGGTQLDEYPSGDKIAAIAIPRPIKAHGGEMLGVHLRHNLDKDGYGAVVLLPQFAFALRSVLQQQVPAAEVKELFDAFSQPHELVDIHSIKSHTKGLDVVKFSRQVELLQKNGSI